MADEILIQYKTSVEGLKAGFEVMKTEMKELQKQNDVLSKKLEDTFVKPEKAVTSLRAQLKKLKEELANATDPKEIERLAKAAGKLSDQLEDAGDAARIFASESKFEQLGSALGSVGNKLMSLDFKGVSDQAKLLGSVIKSFSVKDVIDGIKDMGKAFFDVGKALFANPIFLLGAALAAIGVAAYTIGKSFYEINIQTLTVTESLTAGRKAIQEYADRFEQAQIKIRESLGLTTKSQADGLRANIENNKELRAKAAEHSDAILKLAKELDIDLRTLDDKGNATKSSKRGLSQLAEKGDLIRFNKEKAKLDVDFDRQTRDLISAQFAAKKADEIDANVKDGAESKKILDAIAAKKLKDEEDLNTKLLAEAEKLAKLKKEAQERFEKDNTSRVASLNEAERKKQEAFDADNLSRVATLNEAELALVKKLDKEVADATAKSNADAIVDAEKMTADEIERERRKQDEIKKIQQATVAFISDALNALQQIQQNNIQSEIDGVNEAKDAEIAALDEQLSKRLISQDQYDKKKAAIDDKARNKERELKKKAFESAKEASIITALINTAVAITKAFAENSYPANVILAAIAAASGALQISVIESQPTPKFAKGVVGLKGKGTGTSDEIPSLLSKGESVIIAEESAKFPALLQAMNKKQTANFIKEFYIAPALKAQKKKFDEQKESSFASALMQSMNVNFKDGNLLDSLKQSRKNDREIALFLAKELKGSGYNARNW